MKTVKIIGYHVHIDTNIKYVTCEEEVMFYIGKYPVYADIGKKRTVAVENIYHLNAIKDGEKIR